jgi:hypothetical protein
MSDGSQAWVFTQEDNFRRVTYSCSLPLSSIWMNYSKLLAFSVARKDGQGRACDWRVNFSNLPIVTQAAHFQLCVMISCGGYT